MPSDRFGQGLTIARQYREFQLWLMCVGLLLSHLHKWPLPELHACAPRAHILPEQEVVEGYGVDHVEELLKHLQDDLRVEALVTHDRMECVQLSYHGLQAVRILAIHHAGAAIAVARGLHP